MILDAIKKLAPPLPDYSAKFMGIYFEPVMGSGERFTIGVMVKADSGEYSVKQTIADQTIKCMYGNMTTNFKGFVHAILSSANAHLESGLEIEAWHPPFSGVSMTPIHQTYSKTGIKGVVFQAVTAYSSLCKDKWLHDTINEINGIQTEAGDDPDQSIETLIQQLKKITGVSYENRWQRETQVNNALLNIDYLGINYNANLSNFDVKLVRPAFKLAKAKLFDLDVLRASRKHQAVDSAQQFELLVAIGKQSPLEARNQFDELERLADGIQLRVIAYSDAEAIANHIKQREAA